MHGDRFQQLACQVGPLSKRPIFSLNSRNWNELGKIASSCVWVGDLQTLGIILLTSNKVAR